METRTPAALVLADGKIFRGFGFGATGSTLGEAVFTTAMTGYQETLTDPSYYRQIAVMTAPQIGNTGWNDEDSESRDGKIWAAGLVIRDLSHSVSNWRAERGLEEELAVQGIVGIHGVDTRALTRHLRDQGSIRAGIFTGDAVVDEETMIAKVKEQPEMAGADLTADVTTNETYVVEADGDAKYTVVSLDMGIKANSPREFAKRGVRTVVVPASSTFQDVKAVLDEYNGQGVFISNGPGDPATADDAVATIKEIVSADIPLFGICFGNQLLGRALGLETYKLKFGHRGTNVPVLDRQTGKVAITAQNHGFALANPSAEDEANATGKPATFDTEFGPALVTHICLNDNVVEGVALESGRAFAVQYHPESAAGPHDANPLFDHFLALLEQEKNN